MKEDLYLIEKRGLYYRPNAAGYTGLKSEAGRYSFEEAVERAGPNGPEGPTDGIGIWREHEAPAYSSRCPWDLKMLDQDGMHKKFSLRMQAIREAIKLRDLDAAIRMTYLP